MGRRGKVVWVLIDGLGEVTVPSLDGGVASPLLLPSIENLHSLAESGINGLMDPVEPGLACGSDTAHMSLFGYDPKKHYRGRGAFETMGAGLHMEPGDIAFKSNFATLDPQTMIVTSRRADRNFEEYGPPFCAELDGITLPSFPDHTVSVKYATEHRCGVRVRGPGLSDSITGTDPLKDNLPLVSCEPTDGSSEATFTSRLVNELSMEMHKRLEKSELNRARKEKGLAIANAVLLRGCGCCIDVPSFKEKHGMKAFMIAPTCIIAGLGMTVHFDIKEAPGATGDYHTNIRSKFETARKHITDPGAGYDLGFVHIKAVDDAGHDRNIKLKVKFLEEIDRALGQLFSDLREDERATGTEYVICVTGDHSTPVLSGDHSFQPVPFVISPLPSDPSRTGEVGREAKRRRVEEPGAPQKVWVDGKGYLVDSITRFSEIHANQGVLGRFCGGQAMEIIKQYLEKPTPALLDHEPEKK